MKILKQPFWWLAYIVLLLLYGQQSLASSFLAIGSNGGDISDGLDVKDVRYAVHENFERLVFDIVNWEGSDSPGKPAQSTGHFTVIPEGQNFAFTLEGFRAFSASLPEFTQSTVIQALVRRKGESYEDDSTIALFLTTKRKSCYRAFTLYSPARIVLDVRQCPIANVKETEK